MTKRATNVWLIVALTAWTAMVALFWAGMAHGASASQPASQPTAVPLDNWGALAQMLLAAVTGHNWPVVIVSVCIIALGVERHFKGLTGNKFSVWLGTKLGLFVSSLFTAVVTAASSVAFQGWKVIGNACLAAGLAALANFGVQFVGPATKAVAEVVPAPALVPAPAATPALPDAPPDAPNPPETEKKD